ncbi:hypothetical protein [Paenibacillus sonchi]|uniref:hypothetical protein n=1 Tax=Paenibacillus sonchi TaxID=373687 RepID=UPI001E382ABA|nr:hypothetical protein [Paenibacillus sonchi]MCE3204102.1 hypothetical protein [Paenibacillus sonchi]
MNTKETLCNFEETVTVLHPPQQTIGEEQVPDAAKDAADQAFHKVGDFKESKRSVSQMNRIINKGKFL